MLDFSARCLHLENMKLILSTHNVTLTKSIEEHVVKRIQKLDHFDPKAIDARVTLEHDHTRVPEKQFSCSLRLAVRGPDLFAEDRESDLYAAIDRVTKKIEQQIRKRHNKVKAHNHKDAAKLKNAKRDAGV
jgi:ribosome hibernation promoting factor